MILKRPTYSRSSFPIRKNIPSWGSRKLFREKQKSQALRALLSTHDFHPQRNQQNLETNPTTSKRHNLSSSRKLKHNAHGAGEIIWNRDGKWRMEDAVSLKILQFTEKQLQ